jgi:magnesium transporter
MISRLVRKKTREPGLPPGTLIMEGLQKLDKSTITVITYNEQVYTERTLDKVEDLSLPEPGNSVSWINIRGIHDVNKISAIGNQLKLHPLTLEDILNTDHRPKYEEFENYIFIVLKLISFNDRQDEVIPEQVSLIIGSNFVASFVEQDDPFDPVRKRVFAPGTVIRKMPASYLAYSLIDLVIDSYYTIVEKIGDRIEVLEETLVTNPDTKILYAIHHVKNELVLLRKSVWPMREIVGALERSDTPLIGTSMQIYFRDDYEHIVQIIENTESLRDIVSGMLDIYLSSINNRINAVMKVLTIFASIFIPLTFIASIYGMNFQYMPELGVWWAYPVILLVMAAVAVVMLLYFKRKKWF